MGDSEHMARPRSGLRTSNPKPSLLFSGLLRLTFDFPLMALSPSPSFLISSSPRVDVHVVSGADSLDPRSVPFGFGLAVAPEFLSRFFQVGHFKVSLPFEHIRCTVTYIV